VYRVAFSDRNSPRRPADGPRASVGTVNFARLTDSVTRCLDAHDEPHCTAQPDANGGDAGAKPDVRTD